MALGWPEAQGEHLERRGLNAATPPAHRHAARLLTERNLVVESVVRVERDSVLFVSAGERAMTAWLESDGALVRVFVEYGFPIMRTLAATERALIGSA